MSGKDECRDATLVGDIGVQALVGKQQLHHRVVAIESGTGECPGAILIGDIGVQALVGKQQHHHRGVPLIIHGLEARAGITALPGGSSPAAPAARLAGERIESHPHVHVDQPRLKGQCHRPLRRCCARCG